MTGDCKITERITKAPAMELKTERLILRPIRMSDATNVQRLAGDKAIADTTLNIPHPYEYGMAEQWIASLLQNYDTGQYLIFAVTLRDSGTFIGSIGFVDVNCRFDHAELGYWLGKPYWKKGYATEAAQAMLDYGFKTLNLHRIHACHFENNPASGRVMEKIGMAYEGRLREHIQKRGQYQDLILYGILKADWMGEHDA